MTTGIPMTPNFEVKCLLNPATVLDAAFRPVPDFLSTFNLTPSSATIPMGVQFLDTDVTEELYNDGWSPRIRRKADKPKNVELTYKKRYDIPITIDLGPPGNGFGLSVAQTTRNGGGLKGEGEKVIDPPDDAIAKALQKAADDGFDMALAQEQGFEAQVEWGYAKLTLSISAEAKVKAADWGLPKGGTELPDEQKSRDMLIQNAPGIFGDKGGVERVGRSRIYGPVHAERWEGKWVYKKEGEDTTVDVDIEIWPIKKERGSEEMENVVEISFKVDDAISAQDMQIKLTEVLQPGGWFLAGDSLKTALIMERY